MTEKERIAFLNLQARVVILEERGDKVRNDYFLDFGLIQRKIIRIEEKIEEILKDCQGCEKKGDL